jgi:hypothetical protein
MNITKTKVSAACVSRLSGSGGVLGVVSPPKFSGLSPIALASGEPHSGPQLGSQSGPQSFEGSNIIFIFVCKMSLRGGVLTDVAISAHKKA